MPIHALLAAFALFILAPYAALAAPSPDTAAPKQAPATFDGGMRGLLGPYLAIQDALARDTTDGVADAARRIAEQAAALPKPPTNPPALAEAPEKLAAAAAAVRTAADLKAARDAFKQLSKPMSLWASLTKPAGVDVVYCSMTQGGWLQKTGPIRNPYHGAEMLACGEVVSSAAKAQ